MGFSAFDLFFFLILVNDVVVGPKNLFLILKLGEARFILKWLRETFGIAFLFVFVLVV